MSRIIVSNHTSREYVINEDAKVNVMEYYDIYLNKSKKETVIFCYNQQTGKIEYSNLKLINGNWTLPKWVTTNVNKIKRLSIEH